MAATQKTLTPTNEVISIPAFTDKPDYRLPIDSTEKLADAVNALNSKIESLVHTETKNGTTDGSGYISLTATESGRTRYYLFAQNKTNANYLTYITSGSTYGYSPYLRVSLANGNVVANTQMEIVLHYLLL